MPTPSQTQSTQARVQALSGSELLAELDRLRAENERLKTVAATKSAQSLRCKVTEKGALAVYGLGRFPVTLYLSQWTRLIPFVPEITKFIDENKDKLTTKGDAVS
jgi:hypothetical protein